MCCFCVSEIRDTGEEEAWEVRKMWKGAQIEAMGLAYTLSRGSLMALAEIYGQIV